LRAPRPHPRVSPRAAPPAGRRLQGRTQAAPKPKSPKVRTDELIDEVVYRPN
jgi:hypothetical protein